MVAYRLTEMSDREETPIILFPRELACLQAATRGMSTKATAKQLGISPATVASYRRNLFLKLGVSTMAEAVYVWLMHDPSIDRVRKIDVHSWWE